MTTLPAGWENVGGRVIRKTSAGVDQGETISHPLRGPIPGEASHVLGSWNRARFANTAVADYPSNLGAETAHSESNTLDEALASDLGP